MTDLSPKKRALRLVRNFEAHHPDRNIPALSAFAYMDLCAAIHAYERQDADAAALTALCDKLEGVR